MSDLTVTFFATFYIWFLFFSLVVLWFIDGKIKKEQVVHALFAIFISWGITFLIKSFFPTLRPFMINGDDIGVVIPPTNGAYPSEHTTTAFALAITIFLHDRKVGWFYLISALLIGLFRIIANVHYPIDIVGGALLGTLTAIVVEKVHLFKIFKK